MKLQHVLSIVLVFRTGLSASEGAGGLEKPASLLANLRHLTFDVFPKTLHNQRTWIKKLRHGQTKYQMKQTKALENAKIKAENDLNIEKEKRVQLEIQISADNAKASAEFLAYQETQMKALENTITIAETELEAETIKRVELENEVLVNRKNYERTIKNLNTELSALSEDFEKLKAKSQKVHKTWFKESDDHTQANKFVQDYEDSFGDPKSLLNPSRVVVKVHETGKTCSRVLSRITASTSCDGWSNQSREDCVQKCDKNELPSGCPATDGVCKYAVWNGASNWCQVAKDCDFVERFGTYSADRFILNEVIEV